MVIGLTGSIGSGKSSVAEIAAELGYSVIDCDRISHDINDDPAFIDGITRVFGPDCIETSEGRKKVNRKAVSEKAFSSKENVKMLESVSYPVILARVMKQISAASSTGLDCIVDAPTLFQSGLNDYCDCTIGVVSEDRIRLNRTIIRGGLSEREIIARMAVQPSNQFYTDNCDYIIENNATKEDLRKSVIQLLSDLKGGAND